MAAPVVTVTYEDGTTDTAKLTPRVLVEVERHYNGKIPRMEGTMYGAWHKLGRPGGKFDEWLDTVEEVDESDGEQADPSVPEASDGS